MIRIIRASKPSELTPALEAQLVARFKRTGESVWNMPWLKSALSVMSHSKCAYCETIIADESKYLEVEHYKAKTHYPDDVVSWPNLLPSCKRCNGRKHDHDVLLEPLVDPSVDDPQHHFQMLNYRLLPKAPPAESTIDVLGLNDTVRVVSKRFKIGEAFAISLDKLREAVSAFDPATKRASSRRGRIYSTTEALLLECQPSSQYAATAAHVVSNSPDYLWIKSALEGLKIWDSALDALHAEMLTIRL